jgi:arylsulfatase A-like enzyme
VFKIRTILYKLFFQLMHVTDWLPTLITAAGGNGFELASKLDGIDQWNSISTNQTSTRTQLILNIDEVKENAAIRDGAWKLVIGEPLAKFQISIQMCAMHTHLFRI